MGLAMTAPLQQQIDGATDGATIDFDGAEHTVEETIRISARHNLTIRNLTLRSETDGTEAHAWRGHRWPRNRSHLRVDNGSTGITLDNVTVLGPHPNAGRSTEAYVAALEAQHAFDIDGADGVTLNNVEAYDVYGDFVYIRSSNVTVDGFRFERNGRQGIALVSAKNATIRNGYIGESRRAIFDLENNVASETIDNVLIEHVVTGASRLLWLANGGQGHVSNVTIRHNKMTAHNGTPTIHVRGSLRRGPFVIEDNELRVGGSPAPGFRFHNVDGIRFRRNTVTAPERRQMTAFDLRDCTDVWVGDNELHGFAQEFALTDTVLLDADPDIPDVPDVPEERPGPPSRPGGDRGRSGAAMQLVASILRRIFGN